MLAILAAPVSAQQSGSEQLDAAVYFNSDRTLDLRLEFAEGVVPSDGLNLQLLVDPNRSSSGQHCLGTGFSYTSAIADFTTHCETERRDCDLYDGLWYCADQVMVEKPALKIDSIVSVDGVALSVPDSVETVSTPEPVAVVVDADTTASENELAATSGSNNQAINDTAQTDTNSCLATASNLASAYSNFASQCGATALDCDFHSNLWVCASVPVESLSQSFIAAAIASSKFRKQWKDSC